MPLGKTTHYLEDHLSSVDIKHGSFSSPKDPVVGPLPNGRESWLLNGGDPYKSWDDPPSNGPLINVVSRGIKGVLNIYYKSGMLWVN